MGHWKLLGINAQLLGTDSAQEAALWGWIEEQTRLGEKLVGIGLLDVNDETARFDLWCPDGMKRHDVSTLEFFNATAGDGSANAAAQPAVRASTA